MSNPSWLKLYFHQMLAMVEKRMVKYSKRQFEEIRVGSLNATRVETNQSFEVALSVMK